MKASLKGGRITIAPPLEVRLRGDHVGERKAGYALVLLGEGSQLILCDVVVEVLEGTVADQFFDPGVDEIGRRSPVGPHNIGGCGDTRRFIGL
jgi:hypothetical protein